MEALAGAPLSAGTQAFIRSAYGVLLLLTLLQTLPQARRFFVSDRFGGYAKSSRFVDLIQNPALLPLVMSLWFACAIALAIGSFSVPASALNLALCRYFFIHMRWKGVLRGMGAPGFMTYWLGAAVFFLEYGARYDPSGAVRDAATLAFRIDFAVIMLCAGTYKSLAGYPQGHGMELGMINPWWGYWGKLYSRLPPSHWMFRIFNHLAYGTEIVAGVLMLFPATQFWGALLIFLSFVFIVLHIRLGFLCEVVMLCCFLFVGAGHPLDALLAGLAPSGAPAAAAGPGFVATAMVWALHGYVILLPFAKAGQYYNFLAKRSLPGALQTLLERYTNLFGIIIWRVFSVDVTNFFVRVHVLNAAGERTLYSKPGAWDWASRFRYLHVGEFICFASLFTTLKYHASQWPLFVERLVRYARTIPCPEGSRLVFEYVSMRKDDDRFGVRTLAEYAVDPRSGQVEEKTLDTIQSVREAASVSPVHEGALPGSYAPLR